MTSLHVEHTAKKKSNQKNEIQYSFVTNKKNSLIQSLLKKTQEKQ